MRKTAMLGILAVFVLSLAVGTTAALEDTYTYKTVGLNTFIEPKTIEVVPDGVIITQTETFLRWQPETRLVKHWGVLSDPFGLGLGSIGGAWKSHDDYLDYLRAQATGMSPGVAQENIGLTPESLGPGTIICRS